LPSKKGAIKTMRLETLCWDSPHEYNCHPCVREPGESSTQPPHYYKLKADGTVGCAWWSFRTGSVPDPSIRMQRSHLIILRSWTATRRSYSSMQCNAGAIGTEQVHRRGTAVRGHSWGRFSTCQLCGATATVVRLRNPTFESWSRELWAACRVLSPPG
jgi:hypothetical protein